MRAGDNNLPGMQPGRFVAINEDYYCLLAFTAVELLTSVEEEAAALVLEAVPFTALVALLAVDLTLPAVCCVFAMAVPFVC